VTTPGTLFERNRKIADAAAKKYFLPGYEPDDIRQEALMALWKAARTYDPTRGAKFSSFATLCINARFVELLKKKDRYRNKTLDSTLRTIVTEGEVTEILNVLPHLHQVADLVEERDALRRLVAAILELTEIERRCVIGVATGLSYHEIGEGGPKQVDNALFRARKKLRIEMADADRLPRSDSRSAP